MSVYGKQAFVVLTGSSGSMRIPLFAATRVGKGRALAGGHEGFFGDQALTNPSNSRFLLNAVEWTTGRAVNKARIGLLSSVGMKRTLEKAGAQVVTLDRSNIAKKLGEIDLVCMDQGGLDRAVDAQKAVLAFLQKGGGLIIAGPAWGWIQGAGDKDPIKDHTGNALLGSYGIAFDDGSLEGPFSSVGADQPLLNADQALQSLAEAKLEPKDSALALKTLEQLIAVLPYDDHKYLHAIEKLAQESKEPVIPTAVTPITQAMPLSRLNAVFEARRFKTLPINEIKAHPAAKDFPGSIPAGAPTTPTLSWVDTKISGWHGTGVYAIPGRPIIITIQEKDAKKGLSVRIGSHTDTLWGLDKWERFPEISFSKPLNATKTQIVNPFGGTVYIEVPERCNLGDIGVTVSGAVQQPRYVRGKTSLDAWLKTIRHAPGPWAELEGNLVILSVPSSSVRTLDNPEALMAYWDKVMEACHKLYAAPLRSYPERYCVDRQISAGYMHSGYPIMTWDDVAKTFCDWDKLSKKGVHLWGFYHEMGHNYQQGDWTFEGTGEVTNNLFSIYGQEAVVGLLPSEFGVAHPALRPEESVPRLKKYLANGAKFSDWQNDPFLALSMYLQMRQAFGWEPFTKVFAEYRALPAGQHPRSDDEKRDQWMVRMSKATGKNLGPFFVAWGVPTSEAARKSVADLPSWMPADWPAK
jgi:hypothetical protein